MMWKWNVVIGVLIGFGSVCCRVTVRPQNTVAIRGERTSLECRTTHGSVVREWSFISSSNPAKSKTIIFSNWNLLPKIFSPRFGVDIDEFGSGILYTNETQFDDGGTYNCSVHVDEGITEFGAELIVLESKPVCAVREYDAGSINTECSVGFSGNWAPKMEWRHHSRREAHEDGTLFTKGIAYYNNRTHVTSTLNAVIIIHPEKNSLSVSCKIFFEARDHIFPGELATNIPDFVHIWTSFVFRSTDADAALTTPSLGVVSNTLSGRSTDVTRDMESEHGKDWTIILIGAVVFAIIVISLLSGAIICIIRKKKTKNQCKRNVDVTYQKRTTRSSDHNIYDSILLCDDDGYRIHGEDSIDGYSRIESLCRGSLEPYYVTTLTKQSASREAEKIGKSHQVTEAKTTSADYEKMIKLPHDKVDSAKVPKQQDLDSPKLSEDNNVESETDNAAYYLQVICDSEDKQENETESSSSRRPSEISPTDAYTSLIL